MTGNNVVVSQCSKTTVNMTVMQTTSTPDEKHSKCTDSEKSPRSSSSMASSGSDLEKTPAGRHETTSEPTSSSVSLFRLLLLPAACIAIPMLAVAGALLFIVVAYRLPPHQDTLSGGETTSSPRKEGFVLIHYSTAKFLFASSIASTVAPWLSGCVMALWVFRVGQTFLSCYSPDHISDLPDPHQYSLLMNLMTASLENHFVYLNYALRTKTRLPALLRRAGWVLSATFTMTGIIITCDTVLHYTTNAASFELVTIPEHENAMSRRLSQACVTFDRVKNAGFPCSMDLAQQAYEPTAFTKSQNYIKALHLNQSSQSTIRVVALAADEPASPHLALLLPSMDSIPGNLDFRASTIGASTSCHMITRDCNFRPSGANDFYSAFNCSPNFWGVLGESTPAITGLADSLDPNLPPLAFKPTSYMQFAFFQDEKLEQPYNTFGLNASTGFPSPSSINLSDDQLRNAVSVGIAAGFSPGLLNRHLAYGPNADFYDGSNGYIGFAMSCRYETYDVDYTWVNGSLYDIQTMLSSNGTYSELFHGYHMPHQIGFLDYDLQNAMSQALMQPDLPQILTAWADLYSAQVMSVIGAFLVPQKNIATRLRDSVLVTQVPLAPIAFLIAACISYATFGIILGFLARQVATTGVLQLADMLSVESLSRYAFNEPYQSDSDTDSSKIGFAKSADRYSFVLHPLPQTKG